MADPIASAAPSIPSSAPVVNESSANQAAPISAPIKEAPRTEKIIIKGKEVEVSLDELKRAYGLHKAAYSNMEEAAKIRKEAENLKSSLSKKDIKALFDAGWSEDEFEQEAANFIVKRAQEKSMTPEQRAQLERDQEYKRLKQDADDKKKSEEQKAQDAIQEREMSLYRTAFLNDISKANTNTWLDLNDPIILAHIIQDVSSSLKDFNYDMPVSEAIHRQEERLSKKGNVEKKYLKKLLKSHIPNIDDTDLDALLDSGVKGIRDNSVAAIKKAEAPFAKQKSQSQSSQSIAQPKPEPVRDAQYYRDVKYGRIKPI